MKFKPMLACDADLSKIKYPVYVQPKIDGIRCLLVNGKALTRSGKPIPNDYIRNKLEKEMDSNNIVYDGELTINKVSYNKCCGPIPLNVNDFNDVQSAVMSKEGKPDFMFNIFDEHVGLMDDAWFVLRLSSLTRILNISENNNSWNCVVNTILAYEEKHLLEIEEDFLELGYEGIIIRNPKSAYKQGRSTISKGECLKLKRFKDSEGLVIDYKEKIDKDGNPTNQLGALHIRDGNNGRCFWVGTGFTKQQRIDLWKNLPRNKIIKYKYQELTRYNIPRFPVFIGFRDERDM